MAIFNGPASNQILIPGAYNFEQVRLGQIGNGNSALEFVGHLGASASYGIKFLINGDNVPGLQLQYTPVSAGQKPWIFLRRQKVPWLTRQTESKEMPIIQFCSGLRTFWVKLLEIEVLLVSRQWFTYSTLMALIMRHGSYAPPS